MNDFMEVDPVSKDMSIAGNFAVAAGKVFGIDAVPGVPGTITVVTALQINTGVLQCKTRDLTFTGGIITSVGTETGWGNVPSV